LLINKTNKRYKIKKESESYYLLKDKKIIASSISKNGLYQKMFQECDEITEPIGDDDWVDEHLQYLAEIGNI